MKLRELYILSLLFVMAQGAWGWDGSGTSTDPYLISSSTDWDELSTGSADDSYSGVYFRQTADISGVSQMVGTSDKPFSGIYDGDGHVLTVSLNTDEAFTAPFSHICGATIRHLRIKGSVTGKLHTSGLVGACEGSVDGQIPTNTIYDCQVSATIKEKRGDMLRAGGFIGHGSEAKNVLTDCLFDGTFEVEYYVEDSYFAPFIGWSHYTTSDRQVITNCLENGNCIPPVKRELYFAYSESDGRTDNPITLDRCYHTGPLTVDQGTFVFNEIDVPTGCTYKFASDPTVQFGGKSYWTSGAIVDLTVPEGTAFNHWGSPAYPGLFISDCFKKNGRHQLKDVYGKPNLYIITSSIPEAETERTEWGVTYRYLSRQDYHYYFSDEDVAAKGWHFKNDDTTDWTANLIVYDANGDASIITVVTGYDESDYNDDGVQIHNDLVGDWRKHTHLGMIAPRAFNNSSALKTLYFKDTDANNYNSLLPFDFEIGNEAFANCPNLTEIKMMQYTTEGTNSWKALNPSQVTKMGDDVFLASPNAKVSTHRSVYQDYLSSNTWEPYRNRIIIYDATVEDFTVNGVKYHKFRNANETEALTNSESDKAIMMDNHLRIWNGEYQRFNASSLLDTEGSAKVYYTYVVGVNDSDIDSNDGVMRIYNDPGSYYNYKTLALGRSAITGNQHVKAIEFWQTNGSSENSFSDLKFVIQNGAFKGCTNLKELRLFYYVQDGDDHWETLGPENIIPGNNIFGLSSMEDISGMTDEEMIAKNEELNADYRNSIPDGFKILVSPYRFQDFLNDPNWAPYAAYIEPVDFDPTNSKSDFTVNGLTYSYATGPGGILQTSQTVSQDVSWWTAPRIAAEVAIMIATLGTGSGAVSAASAPVTAAATEVEIATVSNQMVVGLQSTLAAEMAENVVTSTTVESIGTVLTSSLGPTIYEKLSSVSKIFLQSCFGWVKDGMKGLVDQAGKWLVDYGMETATMNQIAEKGNTYMLAITAKEILEKAVAETSSILVSKQAALQAAQLALKKTFIKAAVANALTLSGMVTNSVLFSSYCWGGSGSYNSDALNKGMRENILSNIHQVGLVGGGYVITTPSKNLVYHNYIKSVDDNLTDAVIYAGFDDDGNGTTSNITMTFGKNAFRNKTNLRTVRFHANEGQTSNASLPMLLTIPDSAFVGCTGLTEFNTLLMDNEGGTRALGPENFVLAGDSVFAGLDSLQFHIVIDESRKQDFLDNASWAPLKKYFVYANATPQTQYREYGANYAYAYEQNSIKKENKVMGHLIEHTIVTGMDDQTSFVDDHQGAVKLCNDIGSFNNYQLDYVSTKAFYGNNKLRTVSFTDLYGQGAFGDSYTGLDVTLQDSCFAYCPNLVNLDLVYMKTDGTNELQPITPQQVKIGKGVFDGSPAASIKMMPQQVAWFEADSTWTAYKHLFTPCIIRKTDEGVYDALKDMRYYDPANEGNDPSLWDDNIDLARIAGIGFAWLNDKFTGNDNIHSFADFKQFESVGLDYVGTGWFNNCHNLSNILLPSTIKRIGQASLANCTSLKEIEIPASVTEIESEAFLGSTSLNTVIVRGETPATLSGYGNFDKHDGLKIYVPAGKVDVYKQAWSEYADYIVSIDNYKKVTHITTTGVGQVADLLGLTPIKENSKIRYLHGNYAKYDSLTVSGPLNGDDIAVLRHLMGANAWESEPTDGRLRYLNLWGADLKQDDDNSYNGYGVDEYLEKDNWVGEYMFHNCTALETLVLPASVTEIGENTFQDATSLKRIAVGRNTTKYTRDLLQNLNGIEELVFITNQFASSESSDPWEADIEVVYVPQSQIGDYIGDTSLTRRAQNVISVFEDDAVMRALAENGHHFPSAYFELENVEGIFAGNTEIMSFNEFDNFHNVKSLEGTFTGCTKLAHIILPKSVSYIGSNVFKQCNQLSDIYLSSDSVPTIAEDAFDFQVNRYNDDFHIYVPKDMCKRYREAWPKYAQYINVDNSRYTDEDIITVTVTQENTLAQALGLTVTETLPWFNFGPIKWINSVRGDYSKLRRLKVIGPISGADLSVLRYLAGFCPWTNTRNYAGHLEYIDLYDAQLKPSDYLVAADMYNNLLVTGGNISTSRILFVDEPDVLPAYSFLQAYNLKTLILPKTCKLVRSRALQQCESLETLVIGDDIEEFNWSALDDDAMLTRLYILAKKKPEISSEFAVWRWLCNNYNPTFDAFYVRPSLYEDYLYDESYTGSSWQRTNNISTGEFTEDDSFLAFASHGAATQDDLSNVTTVSGWFRGHEGVKDLTALGYTAIDSLSRSDIEPLTKLERITLPVTLESVEDSLFSNATNLRYVDMLMCDSTNVIADLRERGFTRIGVDSLQTLVYLPQTFGSTYGVNLVVASTSGLNAKTFRLVDDKDYCVPYQFETESVLNSRILAGKGKVYASFLPYPVTLDTSKGKVYKPTGREGTEVVFTEVSGGEMEALKPYLIRLTAKKATLNRSVTTTIPASSSALVTSENEWYAPGYVMRGTLDLIDNATSTDMSIKMLVDGAWVDVPEGNENAYIAPFRAYMLESGGNGVKSLTIRFDDDDATGIDTIHLIDNDGTDHYYDLNGRELPGKPESGVYIYNGKKYIAK